MRLAATLSAMPKPKPDPDRPRWRLALDEIQPTGHEIRTLMGLPGGTSAAGLTRPKGKQPPAANASAGSVPLDPLTLADDAQFKASVLAEKNLPQDIKNELKSLLP